MSSKVEPAEEVKAPIYVLTDEECRQYIQERMDLTDDINKCLMTMYSAISELKDINRERALLNDAVANEALATHYTDLILTNNVIVTNCRKRIKEIEDKLGIMSYDQIDGVNKLILLE